MSRTVAQSLVLGTVVWGVAVGVSFPLPSVTPYNPKPAEEDLILPMPGGAEMVFCPIVVPGSGFWGGSERVVQLGDGEGGIFEGLQRVQVSGSFPAGSEDSWVYYMGKYEVTKGQFAAVMGFDELLKASGDSAENAKLQSLSGTQLGNALAKPLVFVSWHSIQTFIHRYNLWLFDEGHPERVAKLPRTNGAPGFIRLPTEIEWEYAARGGFQALQEDCFKDRLPFPPKQLVKHAWFLKNAKHRLRPIGLRQPNPLGLHDMFGNAQEITADLFRPEIWQGKPGGLAARGGSVATRGDQMRSSRREEVEVYKWDEEKKRMREWRSYNTGCRLAIGSNVVLSSENRTALEREYEGYRNEIRANMPVGKTLDNPMAQAASQLTDVRSTLAQLKRGNQSLAGELSRLERFIEEAEEKLDQAQKESARSTAQDALREATDLGRDVFKLESLRQQKSKAQKLATLSTRYQDIVVTIEKEMNRREEFARQVFTRYGESVGQLGEYGPSYVSQAFQALGGKALTRRAEVALDMLVLHVGEYQKARRVQLEKWWDDFHKKFKDLAD